MNSFLLQPISRLQQLGPKQLERNLKQVKQRNFSLKILADMQENLSSLQLLCYLHMCRPSYLPRGRAQKHKGSSEKGTGTEGPILQPACAAVTPCPTDSAAGCEWTRGRDQEKNNSVSWGDCTLWYPLLSALCSDTEQSPAASSQSWGRGEVLELLWCLCSKTQR